MIVVYVVSFLFFFFFFFKQKTAYEMLRSLVGSEMCIRDRYQRRVRGGDSGTHDVVDEAPGTRAVEAAANPALDLQERFQNLQTNLHGVRLGWHWESDIPAIHQCDPPNRPPA
eukprot:TRINITY_DN528_c0_g1_i25.p1 TRINITY_DN528_c0_g1~~TRINITY_DN528_c0_g1_i25.p1  ORF type:complete len:113 (-),score=28.35 TRINITY_DN528_c0_g1_i25:958-1296(-)